MMISVISGDLTKVGGASVDKNSLQNISCLSSFILYTSGGQATPSKKLKLSLTFRQLIFLVIINLNIN